ncbi:radical SAM/SPASM domain-containing protein [Anoxybacter fermentans]|uniref:radical SAM/SPASM domain-containing protein n=1 Tax=Anoxybacter fermentans TaxID=1323375 RepID=UPI00196A2122
MLEWPFIHFINDELISLSERFGMKYNNIIVTNGYLLDESIARALGKQNIEYVQITLDGTEHIHNLRRRIANGGGSYSTILQGISYLLNNNINTVIRINVDKESINSISSLIDELYRKYKKYVKTKLLSLDIARVYGYRKSFSLSDFYYMCRNIWLKTVHYGFITPSLQVAGIGTFCGAERDSLTDIVVDIFGNLYKCWNYVFVKGANYSTLEELAEHNYEIIPQNRNRLRYVEKASLLSINNGKCLSCNYFPYCQGLCPDLRLRIMKSLEENIYNRDKCKSIVKDYLETQIEALLSSKE